jgi:4-hydroxy-tetrahydrodipicolinate reductase
MKIVKISICGGLGKMGKLLINKVMKNKKLKLESITDKKNTISIQGINIQGNNINSFKNTDVIVDFSRPEATMQILKIAKRLKKAVVIGTTGFNKKQNSLIKRLSKTIPIFKSGNMSLGINLLEYMVNILSKKIPADYQVGISDQHHKKKIDYPSGTALMLANAISKGKKKKLELLKGRIFLNSKKGSPKKNKINFYITRKGNTIGKHSINFESKIENIELKHTAFSRELFADGALKAALWISKKNKGLFDMQDMLNLK